MTALAVPAPRTAGRRLRWSIGVLAAPITVWLLFFFVAPFLVILWYSFGRKPSLYVTHDNGVLSLDRYVEALNPTFLAVFGRTLQISLIGTLLCLVIAFPMAYWMAVKLPARLQGIALALVLVPYWTNFLVRTIGWQIVLSPTSFVADISRGLGLGTPQLLYTPGAVQLGVVYNYLPLMILPLFVAFDRVRGPLNEASKDLGAGRARTFVRISLPLARPGIIVGLLLVYIPLMGDYITATVLGGAQGNMVGQLVASQFQAALNWALGSAMAVLLIIVIVASAAGMGLIAWLVALPFSRRNRVQLEVAR